MQVFVSMCLYLNQYVISEHKWIHLFNSTLVKVELHNLEHNRMLPAVLLLSNKMHVTNYLTNITSRDTLVFNCILKMFTPTITIGTQYFL